MKWTPFSNLPSNIQLSSLSGLAWLPLKWNKEFWEFWLMVNLQLDNEDLLDWDCDGDCEDDWDGDTVGDCVGDCEGDGVAGLDSIRMI